MAIVFWIADCELLKVVVCKWNRTNGKLILYWFLAHTHTTIFLLSDEMFSNCFLTLAKKVFFARVFIKPIIIFVLLVPSGKSELSLSSICAAFGAFSNNCALIYLINSKRLMWFRFSLFFRPVFSDGKKVVFCEFLTELLYFVISWFRKISCPSTKGREIWLKGQYMAKI